MNSGPIFFLAAHLCLGVWRVEMYSPNSTAKLIPSAPASPMVQRCTVPDILMPINQLWVWWCQEQSSAGRWGAPFSRGSGECRLFFCSHLDKTTLQKGQTHYKLSPVRCMSPPGLISITYEICLLHFWSIHPGRGRRKAQSNYACTFSLLPIHRGLCILWMSSHGAKASVDGLNGGKWRP